MKIKFLKEKCAYTAPIIFIGSFFILFLFTGCTKEPQNAPVELSLILTANPPMVAYGMKTSINIVTNADSTISDLEGVLNIVGPCDKWVLTPALLHDTTYHFKSYLNGKFILKEIKVIVNPPVPPTVKITATPAILLLGDSAMIKITKTGYITKTLVNGEVFEGNSFMTGPLTEETKFVVEVFGVDQDTNITTGNYSKDSVIVKVDILSSYLIQNHWYMILMEGIDPYTGVWVKYYSECTYTDTTYFKNDGTLEIFRVCDPTNPYHSIGGGFWSFEENQTVLVMGSRFDILKLEADSLKIIKQSGLVRMTYASKKN